MSLRGKKIVLGITGSIAAYKAASLLRFFMKEGASVQVIMTRSACDFVTPLTFSTLSKRPVLIEMVKSGDKGEWNNHVELGLWADLILIAPAAANTIAKMANGQCDNLLLATWLSARCETMIAPAMDLDMWKHPATQKNIAALKSWKTNVITPGYGELASGLIGEGRMAEPEELLAAVKNHFSKKKRLAGKKILITAGPTHEAIDPVRFISNASTGKMGVEIADYANECGAEVTLVCGPGTVSSSTGVNRIEVTTADEMYHSCLKLFPGMDIAVLSAAVADFRPADPSSSKIKKDNGMLTLRLEETKDILKTLGEKKKKKQLLVGFALETDNEIKNAMKKLRAKNLDLIVLNSLRDKGAGFGYDTNKVTILGKNNKTTKFELKSKREVAIDIVDAITGIM
jgi:phosphopantothenoylcysteine decarboxylase / phosphopantothenate---cysteine ligase